MNTITVTKAQAIKAVMTEPLMGGRFFNSESGLDTGRCSVCAVGAIIRNTRLNKTLKDNITLFDAINDISPNLEGIGPDEYETSQYNIALQDENYLAALSMYFEYLYSHHINISARVFVKDLDQIREALQDFITIHFPDTLTLEV